MKIINNLFKNKKSTQISTEEQLRAQSLQILLRKGLWTVSGMNCIDCKPKIDPKQSQMKSNHSNIIKPYRQAKTTALELHSKIVFLCHTESVTDCQWKSWSSHGVCLTNNQQLAFEFLSKITRSQFLPFKVVDTCHSVAVPSTFSL